jgi:hypothetical protein
MNDNKKIINSFYLQDKLNPDVWKSTEKNEENLILNPEIRKRLLKTAQIFIDYLDVDIFVQDIILIGSLVGYNWSEFSDFDLHILYDPKDLGEDKELYEEMFRLKKTIFNASHDIIIKGFDVEVFAQDMNEKESSVGSYSILNDEWIRFPEKEKFSIDEKTLVSKTEQWMDIIDGVIENAEDEDIEDAISLVKKYREKLRKYRTCGLKREGEFSYENLVFKFLRRNGYIEKLENFKNKFADKKLSLEQENFE